MRAEDPKWWPSFTMREVVEIRRHRFSVDQMTREEPPGVGNSAGEWLVLQFLSSPIKEPSPVIHMGERVTLKGCSFVVDKVFDQGLYLSPAEAS